MSRVPDAGAPHDDGDRREHPGESAGGEPLEEIIRPVQNAIMGATPSLQEALAEARSRTGARSVQDAFIAFLLRGGPEAAAAERELERGRGPPDTPGTSENPIIVEAVVSTPPPPGEFPGWPWFKFKGGPTRVD